MAKWRVQSRQLLPTTVNDDARIAANVAKQPV